MTTNDAIVGDLERPEGEAQGSFSLPALAWLFVALAIVQAVLVVSQLHLRIGLVPGFNASADSSAPARLLGLVGSVATVLLPAGILYRLPSATRTHRLLLAGAGLVAIWTVAIETVFWLMREVTDIAQVEAASTLLPVAGFVLHTGGVLLLALGLARLRGWPTSRPVLGAMLVAIGLAVLPSAVTYVTIPGASASIVAMDFALAIAAGCLLAVPIGAWLDGAHPGSFWIPLAAVSAVGLGVGVLQSIQLLTTERAGTSFFIDAYGTAMWAAPLIALVTLVTFVRALPARRPAA